jgi:hypothetical protein
MIMKPAEYPIGAMTHINSVLASDSFYFVGSFPELSSSTVSPASAIKTAFFAPHGRKYIWLVNGYVTHRLCSQLMMYDLKKLWDEASGWYSTVA